MPHVSIYGRREQLTPIQSALYDCVRSSLQDAWSVRDDQQFQRFFPMEKEDFRFAGSYTEKFTYIEIKAFEGRSVEAKKSFIRLLYERAQTHCGLASDELEVMIYETPRHNCGLGGLPADEAVAVPGG